MATLNLSHEMTLTLLVASRLALKTYLKSRWIAEGQKDAEMVASAQAAIDDTQEAIDMLVESL